MINGNQLTPRIFVCQDGGFNYSPAEEFGEVVILSNREIVPFAASTANVRTVHGIASTITADYRVGLDYLLPTGSPLAMAHMFAVAFKQKGKHRLLKWDARANRYYVYVLEV